MMLKTPAIAGVFACAVLILPIKPHARLPSKT
jgi:hypothetical protein